MRFVFWNLGYWEDEIDWMHKGNLLHLIGEPKAQFSSDCIPSVHIIKWCELMMTRMLSAPIPPQFSRKRWNLTLLCVTILISNNQNIWNSKLSYERYFNLSLSGCFTLDMVSNTGINPYHTCIHHFWGERILDYSKTSQHLPWILNYDLSSFVTWKSLSPLNGNW